MWYTHSHHCEMQHVKKNVKVISNLVKRSKVPQGFTGKV